MYNPYFIGHCLPLTKHDVASFQKLSTCTFYNSGNTYIGYCVVNFISNKYVSCENSISNLFYHFSHTPKYSLKYLASEINSNNSHLIIILQDLIRPSTWSYVTDYQCENFAYFIEKINIPCVVFSLGANTPPDDTMKFDSNLHNKLSPELLRLLNIISDKSSGIGVRGYYTQEILHNLGIDSEPIGCPTFFDNCVDGNLLVKKYDEKSKILVTGGAIVNHNIDNLYNILQCEESLIQLLCYKNSEYSEKEHCYVNDTVSRSVLNGRCFYFCDIALLKSFIKNFDFCIGNRVHTGIAAINCGVPTILTNKDSRSYEMFDLFDLPVFDNYHHSIYIKEVIDSLDYSKFKMRYKERLQNFKSFIKHNGLIFNNEYQEHVYKPGDIMHHDKEYINKCICIDDVQHNNEHDNIDNINLLEGEVQHNNEHDNINNNLLYYYSDVSRINEIASGNINSIVYIFIKLLLNKCLKQYIKIMISSLFDKLWYLNKYDDVNIEPIFHYMICGCKELRDPSPWFSTSYYLRNYTDVAASGMNPFYHYIVYGAKEGRKPS